MKRAVLGAIFAAAIAGTGCGSDGNVQDYCRRGVEALCTRLFVCDPERAGQLYGSQSGCVTQNSSQCSNSACTDGKTFDQSAADQCLAAYPSASCSDLSEGHYPAVCNQVCK